MPQLPRAADEVQAEAIVSMLQLIAAFPSRIADKYVNRIESFQPFINSTRDGTREAACQLIGFILLSAPAAQRDFYISGLLAVLKQPLVRACPSMR